MNIKSDFIYLLSRSFMDSSHRVVYEKGLLCRFILFIIYDWFEIAAEALHFLSVVLNWSFLIIKNNYADICTSCSEKQF